METARRPKTARARDTRNDENAAGASATGTARREQRCCLCLAWKLSFSHARMRERVSFTRSPHRFDRSRDPIVPTNTPIPSHVAHHASGAMTKPLRKPWFPVLPLLELHQRIKRQDALSEQNEPDGAQPRDQKSTQSATLSLPAGTAHHGHNTKRPAEWAPLSRAAALSQAQDAGPGPDSPSDRNAPRQFGPMDMQRRRARQMADLRRRAVEEERSVRLRDQQWLRLRRARLREAQERGMAVRDAVDGMCRDCVRAKVRAKVARERSWRDRQCGRHFAETAEARAQARIKQDDGVIAQNSHGVVPLSSVITQGSSRVPFGSMLPGRFHVPAGDEALAALRAAVGLHSQATRVGAGAGVGVGAGAGAGAGVGAVGQGRAPLALQAGAAWRGGGPGVSASAVWLGRGRVAAAVTAAAVSPISMPAAATTVDDGAARGTRESRVAAQRARLLSEGARAVRGLLHGAGTGTAPSTTVERREMFARMRERAARRAGVDPAVASQATGATPGSGAADAGSWSDDSDTNTDSGADSVFLGPAEAEAEVEDERWAEAELSMAGEDPEVALGAEQGAVRHTREREGEGAVEGLRDEGHHAVRSVREGGPVSEEGAEGLLDEGQRAGLARFEGMNLGDMVDFADRMVALAVDPRDRVECLHLSHRLRQLATQHMRAARQQETMRALWRSKVNRQAQRMTNEERAAMRAEIQATHDRASAYALADQRLNAARDACRDVFVRDCLAMNDARERATMRRTRRAAQSVSKGDSHSGRDGSERGVGGDVGGERQGVRAGMGGEGAGAVEAVVVRGAKRVGVPMGLGRDSKGGKGEVASSARGTDSKGQAASSARGGTEGQAMAMGGAKAKETTNTPSRPSLSCTKDISGPSLSATKDTRDTPLPPSLAEAAAGSLWDAMGGNLSQPSTRHDNRPSAPAPPQHNDSHSALAPASAPVYARGAGAGAGAAANTLAPSRLGPAAGATGKAGRGGQGFNSRQRHQGDEVGSGSSEDVSTSDVTSSDSSLLSDGDSSDRGTEMREGGSRGAGGDDDEGTEGAGVNGSIRGKESKGDAMDEAIDAMLAWVACDGRDENPRMDLLRRLHRVGMTLSERTAFLAIAPELQSLAFELTELRVREARARAEWGEERRLWEVMRGGWAGGRGRGGGDGETGGGSEGGGDFRREGDLMSEEGAQGASLWGGEGGEGDEGNEGYGEGRDASAVHVNGVDSPSVKDTMREHRGASQREAMSRSVGGLGEAAVWEYHSGGAEETRRGRGERRGRGGGWRDDKWGGDRHVDTWGGSRAEPRFDVASRHQGHCVEWGHGYRQDEVAMASGRPRAVLAPDHGADSGAGGAGGRFGALRETVGAFGAVREALGALGTDTDSDTGSDAASGGGSVAREARRVWEALRAMGVGSGGEEEGADGVGKKVRGVRPGLVGRGASAGGEGRVREPVREARGGVRQEGAEGAVLKLVGSKGSSRGARVPSQSGKGRAGVGKGESVGGAKSGGAPLAAPSSKAGAKVEADEVGKGSRVRVGGDVRAKGAKAGAGDGDGGGAKGARAGAGAGDGGGAKSAKAGAGDGGGGAKGAKGTAVDATATSPKATAVADGGVKDVAGVVRPGVGPSASPAPPLGDAAFVREMLAAGVERSTVEAVRKALIACDTVLHFQS